jgi:hypothetical protein
VALLRDGGVVERGCDYDIRQQIGVGSGRAYLFRTRRARVWRADGTVGQIDCEKDKATAKNGEE